MSDNVNMVLATDKKEGMFKYLPCYLVFYDTKIVFANINSEKQKLETKAYNEKLKAEGKGFFKGTIELMKFWFTYGNKYYDMNADDVLAEDSTNFALEYSQINKFKFKASRSSTDDTTDEPGEILIHSGNNKIKLTHKYRDYNKKIKGVLTTLVANSLKYRGGGLGLSINIGGNKDGFS